jgi:hypothetical protein
MSWQAGVDEFHVLPHIELLFAMFVKVPKFLDGNLPFKLS